jgi:hypothetical protein
MHCYSAPQRQHRKHAWQGQVVQTTEHINLVHPKTAESARETRKGICTDACSHDLVRQLVARLVPRPRAGWHTISLFEVGTETHHAGMGMWPQTELLTFHLDSVGSVGRLLSCSDISINDPFLGSPRPPSFSLLAWPINSSVSLTVWTVGLKRKLFHHDLYLLLREAN